MKEMETVGQGDEREEACGVEGRTAKEREEE